MELIKILSSLLFVSTISMAADIHQIDPNETEQLTPQNHNPCATVIHNNSTTKTYFVPGKTDAEWLSFYNNVGNFSELSISGCSSGCGAGGVWIGAACWYRGDSGESCTTVCSTHGGYNSQTLTYAGSSGSNSNCDAVAEALNTAAVTITTTATATGCHFDNDASAFRRGTTTTTAAQTSPTQQRMCACTN